MKFEDCFINKKIKYWIESMAKCWEIIWFHLKFASDESLKQKNWEAVIAFAS